MAKSKKSEPCTPEEHLANLQWMIDNKIHLDARQWAKYRELKQQVGAAGQSNKWWHE